MFRLPMPTASSAVLVLALVGAVASCGQAQPVKPLPIAEKAAPGAPASPLMTQKPDETYAQYLDRLVKAWPADLSVAFMGSSGGVPPYVNRWQVDSQGVGEFERIGYHDGKQTSTKWPVRLQLSDLKALVGALAAVDWEHARRPVPDSPVQSLSISSGGQASYIDALALLPPVCTADVQAKVFDSLAKLTGQSATQQPHPQPDPQQQPHPQP